VYFQQESRRYYPKGELAAQVLGYVGMDDEGLAGLEHAYENDLAGKPGTMVISMDARKRRFARVEKKPEPGENLVLTIDEKIQWIAEREVDQAMIDTKAEAAMAVVQNPRTGEILALVNRPTFNPNNTKKITPAMLKDRAVSDIYGAE
jgi:cell division protein FtsI (penicillin-binding protein 3)